MNNNMLIIEQRLKGIEKVITIGLDIHWFHYV